MKPGLHFLKKCNFVNSTYLLTISLAKLLALILIVLDRIVARTLLLALAVNLHHSVVSSLSKLACLPLSTSFYSSWLGSKKIYQETSFFEKSFWSESWKLASLVNLWRWSLLIADKTTSWIIDIHHVFPRILSKKRSDQKVENFHFVSF